MKAYIGLMLILLSFSITCCSDSSGKPKKITPIGSYQTKQAFPNLSFTRPVDLQHSPDNTNRLFVMEQAGVISVFANDSTVSSKNIFLDIRTKIDNRGNEEGLLGLAFHPDFQTNGFFYVNYTATNPDRTVVSRFQVSSNINQADPDSEQLIITFAQPYENHNGGQISFGPDGYLYVAAGDGGSGGDPQGNGQNRAALLGKILRIDVNKQENGNAYGIPPDNPFANNSQGYRKEIYAYGMRNPWRFSFDVVNGQLWVGDVGQDTYEEIDMVEKGGNYGWNVMEAKHCFNGSCDPSALKLPIWEYGHDVGVSVTGGFVYRGAALPELKGKYIYADYGTRKIWALDYSAIANPVNTELFEADFNISSFGVDHDNELYLCGFDGKIHRLVQK